MLEAAGVEGPQGSGSRVLLKKAADRVVILRPHPETETGRATVRDIATIDCQQKRNGSTRPAQERPLRGMPPT